MRVGGAPACSAWLQKFETGGTEEHGLATESLGGIVWRRPRGRTEAEMQLGQGAPAPPSLGRAMVLEDASPEARSVGIELSSGTRDSDPRSFPAGLAAR